MQCECTDHFPRGRLISELSGGESIGESQVVDTSILTVKRGFGQRWSKTTEGFRYGDRMLKQTWSDKDELRTVLGRPR
jgi:hypothetical protein